MNNSKYTALVNNLVSQGVNFELSVFNRNSSENCGIDWNELAREYGYRKPKNGYFCRGGHFYMLLQRVYRNLNK